MARRNGNGWARAAAWLTSVSHSRAPLVRWGTIGVLAGIWLWAGYTGWMHATSDSGGAIDGAEAAYRTIAALGPEGSYMSPPNLELAVARFAGLAVPLAGILFAFSAQLGRSMARLLNKGAAGHVVIAGQSAPALSLAFDCVAQGDVVMLIASDILEETGQQLQSRGVTLVVGDGTRADVLRTARAYRAAHVVAFDADDARNLQVEAAMRALMGARRRRAPLAVHVSTTAPLLLREAREMRSREQRRRDRQSAGQKRASAPAIDARPFSLHEIGARMVLQGGAAEWLEVASALNQDRVHLVFFGFDAAAEAIAVRTLMSVWSATFDPPRITVLTPDPRLCELRFRARYPQALDYPGLWRADIAFRHFDWGLAAIDVDLLQEVQAERGQATAAVVATGEDAANIAVALSVLRACERGDTWPIPIYMHETCASEFSRQYAAGDETPDQLDAYLQAFGAHEQVANRALILEGEIDRGAAIAHAHYVAGLGERDALTLKELQAAAKGWEDVLETYRAANRAVADSAVVKLWDAGWVPATAGEPPGQHQPAIPPARIEAMARCEHDRWVAERLLSGWRPGETRDNDLLVHPNLKPWSQLTADEQERDAVQVRASIAVACAVFARGFHPARPLQPQGLLDPNVVRLR